MTRSRLSSWASGGLVVIAVALCWSILASWPLALDPVGQVVGEKMPRGMAFGMWLMRAPLSAWWQADLEHLAAPSGGALVPVGLPQWGIARLLLPLTGPVLAANLSILFHLAIGVVGVARLATVWAGARWWGGGLTPLAVGLSAGGATSVLAAVSAGQVENLGLVYLALAGEGAIRVLRGRLWGGALLLVMGLTLTFLSSPYLLMGTLLAAPVLAGAAMRRHAVPVVTAAVLVVLVSVPFVHRYGGARAGEADRLACPAVVERSPGAERRLPVAEALAALHGPPPVGADLLVADPVRMFAPGRSDAGGHHAPMDYLGWVVLTAAVGGAWLDRRSRWLLLACLPPLVLALGPYLQLRGWALTTADGALIPLPLGLASGLPLVGPVLETIQVPVRLLFGVSLLLALAGLPAWSRLERWARRRGPAIRLGIGVLALAPAAEPLLMGAAAPPMPAWPVPQTAAWRALALQGDHRALVETPVLGWGPRSGAPGHASQVPAAPPLSWINHLTFGHVVHGRPMAIAMCVEQGFHSPEVEASAMQAAVAAILAGQADPPSLGEAAQELGALGFGWYVIHTRTGLLAPPAEARLLAAARADLELVAEGEDGSYLFRLPTPAGP
ncbi:hypothetical protein L6R53_26615 [Myxococcota bacterium]|nr:hypothetical protein [Myxococcota bacterium]